MIPKYLQQLASGMFGPQGNNLADPSHTLSWSLVSYVYSDLFLFYFLPPNPQNYTDLSVIFLSPWYLIFSYKLYNHLQKSTSWFDVPSNIVYIR
jgi:hypothetical protein